MYHGGQVKDGPRQACRRWQGLRTTQTKAIRMLPDVMARVQHGMGHVQSSCSCSDMFGCSESLQVDQIGGVSQTLQRSIHPLQRTAYCSNPRQQRYARSRCIARYGLVALLATRSVQSVAILQCTLGCCRLLLSLRYHHLLVDVTSTPRSAAPCGP